MLGMLRRLIGLDRVTLDDQIRGVLRWAVPDGLSCSIGYDVENRCLVLEFAAARRVGIVAIPPGEPVDGDMMAALDEAARVLLALDADACAAAGGDARRHDEAEVRDEERSASPTGCDPLGCASEGFLRELKRLRLRARTRP